MNAIARLYWLSQNIKLPSYMVHSSWFLNWMLHGNDPIWHFPPGLFLKPRQREIKSLLFLTAALRNQKKIERFSSFTRFNQNGDETVTRIKKFQKLKIFSIIRFWSRLFYLSRANYRKICSFKFCIFTVSKSKSEWSVPCLKL